MARTRWWMLGLAIAAGVALSFAAPDPWDVKPFHGALFGSALYISALRKRERWLPRAAAFLALAGAQAYLLYEAAPAADLRASFVILSTWIVLETAGGGWNVEKAGREGVPVSVR